MPLHDFLTIQPVTPVLIWSFASVFLTTSEGGRFRWGNIYGNTAICLAAMMCNSLQYTVAADREASICGMATGALTMVLPAVQMVRWERVVPRPASTIIGAGLIGYYGRIYAREVYDIEDAGED